VHEILAALPPRARVLDLGARSGSFDPALCPGVLVVRLDLNQPPQTAGAYAVQADAAALPFDDNSFDAVIANHSLEHMTSLVSVLSEMGRVVHPSGAVYVAVPDSSTVSDRVYRWVYHGGGHVNPFDSQPELARLIETHVRLPLAGWRVLHTSFGFLDRCHFQPCPPRRMWILLNGRHEFVVFLSWAVRVLDRLFGTRLSVYGWALLFGHVDGKVDEMAWSNVCVRCGSAQPDDALEPRTVLWPIRMYRCPVCRSRNFHTRDQAPTYRE
jgi:SAM-dependent methyltransferase